MNKFAAAETARILATMQKVMLVLQSRGSKMTRLDAGDMQEFDVCADHAEKIDCLVTAASFRRFSKFANPEPAIQLAARLSEMAMNFDEELNQKLFFNVPVSRADWHSKTAEDILGPDCMTRFTKRAAIGAEAVNAAHAFTFGLYTACAFHLMRISEAGIRALARAIEHPIDETKNWGKFFKQYDQCLAVDPRNRTGIWQENSEFLEAAGGNMRAVKNAWRNNTMHLDNTYVEEQAKHLLEVIPAFMRHLASHLDEDGILYP